MTANSDPLEAAVDVVIAFATEMNTWERRMNARSRMANGDLVRDKLLAEAVASLSYDEVFNEYHFVFQKYCTQRERTHAGLPTSWSRDGKYKGTSHDTVFRSDLESPDRACVYVRGGDFPDNRFKFVLFRKGDGWRIDNAYSGSSDDGPWERHSL